MHYKQNKNLYGIGGDYDSGHTMPTGRTYFRGSQKITAPIDFSTLGYDEQDLAPAQKLSKTASTFSIEEPTIAPKSKGNRFTNFISGYVIMTQNTRDTTRCMNARIPAADYSVSSILLGFLYIAVNIGCLWLNSNDMAKGRLSGFSITECLGLGTLIGANFLFLTIPATRNSLLVYLFGFPFDKSIMYHRYLLDTIKINEL